MKKMTKKQKLLADYKKIQPLLKSFKKEIEKILTELLNNTPLKCQKPVSRIKKNISLKRKLEQYNFKKIESVHDLLGFRLVFYLDKDAERFSSLLAQSEKIKILKYDRKLGQDGYYHGIHHIIQLDNNLVKQPKYSEYEKLKCEVQITTVLQHAANEVAHDTLYKMEDELKSFNETEYEAIKRQFEKTVSEKIIGAQHDLDFLSKRAEDLKEGREFFGNFKFSDLISLNNNCIYDQLSLYKTHIENCNKVDLPKEVILPKEIDAILEKARSNKVIPINNRFVELEGRTFSEVLELALDIVDFYRYQYPKENLALLLKLHQHSTNDKDIQRIEKSLEDLCSYNYYLLKRYGYQFHGLFIESLLIFPKSDSNLTFVLKALSHLLKKDIRWDDYDGESVKLHMGVPNATPDLNKINKSILKCLSELFIDAKDDMSKLAILKTMKHAIDSPVHLGKENKEMEKLLRSNVSVLLKYYLLFCKNQSLVVMSKIDESICYIKRRYGFSQSLNLRKIEKVINRDVDYKVYKLLIYSTGHNRLQDKSRASKIEALRRKYGRAITKGDQTTVQKTIFKIINSAKYKQNFMVLEFGAFLRGLCKDHPLFGLQLLRKHRLTITPFIADIIQGCVGAGKESQIVTIISGWVCKERFMCEVVNSLFFISSEKAIFKIVKQILVSKKVDLVVLQNLCFFLFQKEFTSYKPLNDIVAVIKRFNTNKKPFFDLRMMGGQFENLLEGMTGAQWNIFLTNLKFCKRLDYHHERVLFVLAKKNPKLLIRFFYERVEKKSNLKKYFDNYSPIPEFYDKLGQSLKGSVSIVLQELRKWWQNQDTTFQWYAAQLVSRTIPINDSLLNTNLLEAIKQGKIAVHKMVFSLFKVYGRGCWGFKEVWEALIDKYSSDESMKNEMFCLLSQTGCVMGEDGFVLAHQSMRDSLKTNGWIQSENSRIKIFANDFDKYLSVRIREEQKQARDRVEERKRKYAKVA